MSFNKRPFLLSAMFAGVLSLTGCANMTGTAIDAPASVSGSGLSGTIHGGRQPVAGATVTLWAAGNAGYGSAATSLASTTSDGGGNFSFHVAGSAAAYTCPSTTSTTTSQSIYITAVGGTPTVGISNASAAFLLALGDCSTVAAANPNVTVNEVTTIASMFALAQFYSPGTSGNPDTLASEGSALGTSPTNIAGLVNAMNTVGNLIIPATGGALASTTATGSVTGYGTNPVVTITPEQSKINLLANILAACVNSTGVGSSACNSLYNKVSSPSAIDTIQATYYLATNPTSTVNGTSNITTICGGAVASSPFQPAATCNVTDWTVGVQYSSASTSTAGVPFVGTPQYVAVDGSGNVWFTNYSSTAGSLSEIGPTGIPLAQPAGMIGLTGPTAPVIDPSNNVWVAIYGTTSAIKASVLEYNGTATNTFTTNNGPQRLAIDGQGNVFIIEPSYKGSGDLEEIAAGYPTGTAATTLATGLTSDFSNLAIDGNNTVWITGGGTGALGGTSGYPYIYQFLEQPTVTFTGGGPSIAATANAKFVGGKLTAINLSSGGSGYTSAPTVTIGGGGGTGATATATFGTATSLTLSSGGAGYTVAPTVVFSAPPSGGTLPTATATITGGAVSSLTLTSPGSGYATAPSVSFMGGGSGVTSAATASASINTGVSAITVTAAGSGYTVPYHTTPDSTTNVGSVTAPENSISVDGSNNVFIQNYGKETASEISGLATVTGNTSSPYTMPAALTKPEFQTADGAGNLWITQAASTGNVFEISNTGASISPAAGYARTISYNEPYNVAIDPSGNVWVSDYQSSTSITAAITEIIGAAVPVVTPIAAGLPIYPGGTNKLATMP